MLIERQVSIFAAALGGALALPQYQIMSRPVPGGPGASLAVGVLIGAAGVFMGGAVAAGWDHRVLRVAGLTFWTAVGLAFAAVSVVGVLHSHTWLGHVGFALLALPPVAGPAWIFVRLIQG